MIIKRIKLQNKKEINLYPIGDLHIDSENFELDRFLMWRDKFINDKNAMCVILGDIIDDDRPSTRLLRKSMINDRKEVAALDEKHHLEHVDNKIIPLLSFLNASNCLGMLDGDHYREYTKLGITSTQYLCAKLKVPYLGDGQAILNLSFNYSSSHTLSFPIHVRHGIGYNKNQGGTNNRNQEFSEKISGINCFIRAHSHNCIITNIGKYEFDKYTNDLINKDVWLINTGSFRGGFIKQVTDYSEFREYPNVNKFNAKMNIKVVYHNEGPKQIVTFAVNAEYI